MWTSSPRNSRVLVGCQEGGAVGWLFPSVEFPVDESVDADSVGGVVVGSDGWAGCWLGSSGGMVG